MLRILLQGASSLPAATVVGALTRCARLRLDKEVTAFARHLATSQAQGTTQPAVAAAAALFSGDMGLSQSVLETSGTCAVHDVAVHGPARV